MGTQRFKRLGGTGDNNLRRLSYGNMLLIPYVSEEMPTLKIAAGQPSAKEATEARRGTESQNGHGLEDDETRLLAAIPKRRELRLSGR